MHVTRVNSNPLFTGDCARQAPPKVAREHLFISTSNPIVPGNPHTLLYVYLIYRFTPFSSSHPFILSFLLGDCARQAPPEATREHLFISTSNPIVPGNSHTLLYVHLIYRFTPLSSAHPFLISFHRRSCAPSTA